MSKTITINQDSLITLKENMVGINNVSHNTVCVNEATPEVDEYELGQETDNPPVGGNYCHVNEVYNVSERGDLSNVDYIDYVPHDNAREEGYDESNITEFEPYYELMCYSNDGELIFSGELTLNELFDYFPDRVIHMMSNKEGRKVSQVEYRIEDMLSWDSTPNNIDDVEEVNAIAKRIQPGGPSAYLLIDGDTVSFPDHIQITSIDGMTPSKFVGLGNIRLGHKGIELAKKPTMAQISVLKDVMRGEDEFYLDIVQDKGKMYPECLCGAVYKSVNPNRIINDIIYYFEDGVRPQGNMAYESKRRYKNLIENIDFEVNSSDIDLSSFKKKEDLAPRIWDGEGNLNPKVRLRLLDIADDFWEFVNLTWVKPSGIILTGSICNFNWSKYSDIDLHLIVDFDEIDEKTEFVRDYLDSKKNEWNNEHSELMILGFPVELYVQNLNEMPQSGGIYDLEENEWVKKPNSEDIKPIGLDKFSIKDKAAEIMTIIDDMYTVLESTSDLHEIEEIGENASYLWKKVKKMRKTSLEKNGESGAGNIVYKILRRTEYLNKLWKLSTIIYDRKNSIHESKSNKNKYKVYINGKIDDTFSNMNWKRKPKVGKGFYYGGAVFKIKKVTDDSIYAIEEAKKQNKNIVTENTSIDVFALAKERFGVTNDIRECGYVLPDGSMLDFSGRHMLTKGTDSSHLRGRRSIDHREISDLNWDADMNTRNNLNINMADFIRMGAIRIHCSNSWSSINLFKKPTSEQVAPLLRLIQYSKGNVTVEIGDGDNSYEYAEWDEANPRRVINDVIRYFDGVTVKLVGNVTESKEIIKEYLEKDYNMPLYKYFKWATTATDFEKVEDLIYQCSYETKQYIAKMSRQISEFEPLRLALIKDEDIMYDDEFVENIANIIVNNNLTDAFIYYLQVTSNSYDLPSWLFMDFNRVVKNEWCIHFGADSESIAREGFTGGTEEIEHLAYTSAGQQKHGAGYDFAFPLGERDIDNNEYGDEAVIFQTSGVEIYHHGDTQKQVIFWGPYAKNFIPIKYDGEIGDWCIYGMNNQVLKSGSPSTILNWVLNNLPQYRKQIMAGKNGYIPKYYDYNQRKRVPYPIYRNESVKKYLTVLKEEWVGDGNSEHNPYKKRWDAERKALKDFVANYGKLMQSKENGKLYKCYYDKVLSQLIGYNYCICIQWDSIEMKPKSVLYIRALDKFTPNIKQVNFDARGRDNMAGTYDDFQYRSQQQYQ